MADRDIADDNEFQIVVDWLNQNKNLKGTDRYNALRQKAADYIDRKPSTSTDEAAANRTPFGNRVAQSAERPPLVTVQQQRPAPQQPPQDPRFGQQTLPDLNQLNQPNSTKDQVNAASETPGEDLMRRLGIYLSAGWNGLVGGADVGKTALAGTYAQMAGGLAALKNVIVDQNMDKAADTINAVSQYGTPGLWSDAGKGIAAGTSVPLEAIDNFNRNLAQKIGQNDPFSSAVIYTALNSLPLESGIRSGINGARSLAALRARYAEYGMDINKFGYKTGEELALGATPANTGVPAVRGQAIEQLPQDVKNAAATLRDQRDAAWEDLRDTKTNVSLTGIESAVDHLKNDLQSEYAQAVLDDPKVRESMKFLDGLVEQNKEHERVKAKNEYWAEERPGDESFQMPLPRNDRLYADLYNFRRRLKSTLPNNPEKWDGVDLAQARIKSALDNFVNNQFTEGLINGDPSAGLRFEEASRLSQMYRENFKVNREVNRLVNNYEANPEDFRKYIYGLGQSGMKTEAAQVMQKIKDIFGEDSPQFRSIKTEFLSDVLQPLRPTFSNEPPNLEAFVKNWEKYGRNNAAALKVMSPDGFDQIEALVKAAKAAINAGEPSTFTIRPAKVIARFGLGHSIARHGALVNAGTMLLEAVFGRNKKVVQRDILSNLAGRNIDDRLISGADMQKEGIWANAIREAGLPENQQNANSQQQ